MRIVTSEQMRRIEARSEQAGVSTDQLMEQAGLQVAQRVQHHLGDAKGEAILVLVGPGNNGGDGLVAARHLHSWGAALQVYLCADRRHPDPKLDLVQDLGVPVGPISDDDGLDQLREALKSAHIAVDAVLGTGRARPIGGKLERILSELAAAKRARPDLLILAVDLPTGLDADTGTLDPVSPVADFTVALGHPKVGLFAFPGAENVGALEVVDIGLPNGVDEDVALELMTPDWARASLPPRPSMAHKGTFGRTLVVAGSINYVGAAYLAATACTRVGAGLVTVAVPESLIPAVAAKAAEPTYLPLPESSPGVVTPEAAAMILDSLSGYDALLIGCGLGQATATRKVVERLLYSDTPLPPTVVDADGLNILSMTSGWWRRFSSEVIVTPHPGEMARLSGESPEAAGRPDRTEWATGCAGEWGKVTVLKGAYTVVAHPSGSAMLSPFANPGLASAGTGDVLAGVIAGLLSQGLKLADAASLGVYLHGVAGERVREKIGDTGMVASDLLPALPIAINELRSGG